MNAYEQIRYALLEAKGWLIECLNKDNPPTEDGINDAIDRVDAVVALPRRNCDVGTAEEQTKRLRENCNKYKPSCKGCKYVTDLQKENCWLKWAQMPYAAQEGGRS